MVEAVSSFGPVVVELVGIGVEETCGVVLAEGAILGVREGDAEGVVEAVGRGAVVVLTEGVGVGVGVAVGSIVGVVTIGVSTLAVPDTFVSTTCRPATSFNLSSNHPACANEEMASNASRF